MKLSEIGLDAPTSDPIQAAGDALEAQAETQARLVATYFSTLRINGVPLELAEKLTLAWHDWKPEGKFWLVKTHQAQAD